MNEQLTSKVKGLIGGAKGLLKKLSYRERIYLAIALLMILGSGVYQIYKPVREAFRRQSEEQKEVEDSLQQVSAALARYAKLKVRQSAIEQQYKGADYKEEAILPYLEDLIRDKAGIASGFVIQPKAKKEFGGNYEQLPFFIRFTITDFPRLVEYLKELVDGKYPMILGVVQLNKRPAGDALDVELEVSSVRRVKKE